MINPSPQVRRTNPLAVAALICGIVQFAKVPFLDIIAVILGHKALRQIRQTGDDGYGMAKVGLILGYIGIALDIVLIGVVIFLLIPHSTPFCPSDVPRLACDPGN